MYLSIGGDMAVKSRSIVGIFDIDNTSVSAHTRKFFSMAEDEGQVISVTDDLPKSFILTSEYGLFKVYLTQFSAATLEKRLKSHRIG